MEEHPVKLFRFEYSCYARKVQMVLDLLGARYDVVDVPYGDRTELAELTGGYIQVPVLVDDTGRVLTDSRDICRNLLARDDFGWLAPAPWQGPVWAYADWADGALEDVLFRLASPALRIQFAHAADRALFTFVKERKFGAGCIEQWQRDHASLLARARELLAPTRATLSSRRFLFGDTPTLADAALYGQLAMLYRAQPRLPESLGDEFPRLMADLEGWRRAS